MIRGAQRRARHPSPRLAIMAVIMMTWLPAMVRPPDAHIRNSDSRGHAPLNEVEGHGLGPRSATLLNSSNSYVPRSATVHIAGGGCHPSTPTPGHFGIHATFPGNMSYPERHRGALCSRHDERRHAGASSLVVRHGTPASLSTWDTSLRAWCWVMLMGNVVFAVTRALHGRPPHTPCHRARPRRIHRRWRGTRPTGVVARRRWRATWARYKCFALARTAEFGFRHRSDAQRPPRVPSAPFATLRALVIRVAACVVIAAILAASVHEVRTAGLWSWLLHDRG